MPILDQYERLPLGEITVLRESRQRREVDPTSLLSSIQARGVLHPIIVRRPSEGEAGRAVLVSGERRLAASRQLELENIPVRWLEGLDQLELEMIELEENIKRTDLEWQDQAKATQRLHQLFLQRDAGWTLTETAREIGLHLSTISILCRVAEDLAAPGGEKLLEADTYRAAYNIIARKDAREQGAALEELLGSPAAPGEPSPAPSPVPPPEAPVLCTSFLEWAPAYSGEKFNLLHCDFPYGSSAMQGPQAGGTAALAGEIYEDSLEVYLALLDCLVEHLPRLLSISSHLLFWCSGRVLMPDDPLSRETWLRLRRTPLRWQPFPLIWLKSDNAGIAGDTRHSPRHIYETALLGSLGSRQLCRIAADSYSAPTDRSLHPSTKPEPMLRHFFSMLVDEHTSLLDPTAGSGAALRAADSLGAKRVLGLEISPEHAKTANQAFRTARLLRAASKSAAPA